MGVFAIAGIPPFAGFFSKDEILYEAFQHGTLGNPLLRRQPLLCFYMFVGLVTAGMTT
jgi:NADH-quinone oxidoreductase subunit L